jgi:hypothetical protein
MDEKQRGGGGGGETMAGVPEEQWRPRVVNKEDADGGPSNSARRRHCPSEKAIAVIVICKSLCDPLLAQSASLHTKSLLCSKN